MQDLPASERKPVPDVRPPPGTYRSLAGRRVGARTRSPFGLPRTTRAATAEVLGASATPTTESSSSARHQGPPDVWAVVVGIDDYPGSRYDLAAGVADARDVDTALDRFGVPRSHRRMLLDHAADASGVRDALTWLVDHAGSESTAVVFFSGHVRRLFGDPDRDGEVVDESLFLSDGSDLVDGEMADALRSLRSRHAWIGVAGCYAAGFDDVLAPGRVLTAAASENDLAYENDRFDRTYLVQYMVRGAMLGDGQRSVQDAFAQAATRIAHDYPDRVPVMIDDAHEPVEL